MRQFHSQNRAMSSKSRTRGKGNRSYAALGTRRGAVAILLLFLCLALALSVQVLVALVIVGQRTASAEADGRQAAAWRELALSRTRERALGLWAADQWEEDVGGRTRVQVTLSPVLAGEGWLLAADAHQTSSSSPAAPSLFATSALLERGSDGIDLPLAAVVASEVREAAGRTSSWLTPGIEPGPAVAYLVRAGDTGQTNEGDGTVESLPPIGTERDYCVKAMASPWCLAEGWREVVRLWGQGAVAKRGAVILGRREGVVPILGAPGQTVQAFRSSRGGTPETPVLIVVTGGAWLDLRGQGEMWGVVVADHGGVEMDGTCLHGAVFATGKVDVGSTGVIVFDKAILRWATDETLWRVRLMPGSRGERLE